MQKIDSKITVIGKIRVYFILQILNLMNLPYEKSRLSKLTLNLMTLG